MTFMPYFTATFWLTHFHLGFHLAPLGFIPNPIRKISMWQLSLPSWLNFAATIRSFIANLWWFVLSQAVDYFTFTTSLSFEHLILSLYQHNHFLQNLQVLVKLWFLVFIRANVLISPLYIFVGLYRIEACTYLS